MATRKKPNRPHERGQTAPQTTFLAPEDAVLLADLTRLRALVAELTARYRPAIAGDAPAVTIRSPRDVMTLLLPEAREAEQEHLWLLLLNSKNHVINVVELYRGTVNASSVRVAELFREAIRQNAVSVVLAHNHPSSDVSPSPEDVRVTSDAVKAGTLLDLEVLDHVILGKTAEHYTSLKERQLGFS